MSFVRGCFQWIMVLVTVVLLSACTASSRVVKVYEGDTLPPNQVAKLEVPEDIDLVELDGKAQKDYLLENLALTYDLTPGEHTVVYKYAGLWSKTRQSNDAEERRAEVVESELRQTKINMVAGKTYTFNFVRPESRADAQKFAKTFSAVLVTDEGRSVAKDSRYVKPSDTPPVAATISQPATAFPATTSGAAVTASVAAIPAAPVSSLETGLSRLDALKVLWGKSSAEEKKEFLRWAFQ